MNRVLIIGGSGRIGSSIAQDLLTYTNAEITVTGRSESSRETAIATLGSKVKFRILNIDNREQLQTAIADADLVIHSAGPFHHRDTSVLQTCIQRNVNYLDVSDERGFTRQALSLRPAAQQAGITALINTGIFPGISNSMARQGVEQFDRTDSIHLSYVVAGSGGAGVTVMRTTFIGLQKPFEAWLDGKWQPIEPYTERETLDFPAPYHQASVYWYDMPEAFTLPESFPVQTVITKFGVFPDFYNHLTWMAAHWFPTPLLQHPATVEFLAQVSYRMTNVTDLFSGTGVAVRCAVQGQKAGKTLNYLSTCVHPSAAVATGLGTGSLAQLILEGKLHQPGVFPVEQALTTDLFQNVMKQRQFEIQEQFI